MLVGALDAVVFVLVAASVLAGEFLPSRRKPISAQWLSGLVGHEHGKE